MFINTVKLATIGWKSKLALLGSNQSALRSMDYGYIHREDKSDSNVALILLFNYPAKAGSNPYTNIYPVSCGLAKKTHNNKRRFRKKTPCNCN